MNMSYSYHLGLSMANETKIHIILAYFSLYFRSCWMLINPVDVKTYMCFSLFGVSLFLEFNVSTFLRLLWRFLIHSPTSSTLLFPRFMLVDDIRNRLFLFCLWKQFANYSLRITFAPKLALIKQMYMEIYIQ